MLGWYFNYSEATMKLTGETSKLAHLWFGNLFCDADTGSYYHPEREWVGSNQEDRHYEQSDYGNDRVGWGRTATASWTFDRDHAGYAGQFIWTGTDYIGEPTPWHNQNDTPVKSSYFGIVDTAGFQRMIFTFTKVNGYRPRNIQWFISCHIGTGTIQN